MIPVQGVDPLSANPMQGVSNPAGLVIRARTQARLLKSTDPRARRLERLAEQLENIIEERRRLAGVQHKPGENS